MQISPTKIKILKNRLGAHLKWPKWRFCKKKFLDISQKKFGSAYAQSPRKCSNIEILAKIEGKEAKFFSKIYKGHLKVHKIEIFFGFDFEICTISLLVMSKY